MNIVEMSNKQLADELARRLQGRDRKEILDWLEPINDYWCAKCGEHCPEGAAKYCCFVDYPS